MEEPNRQLDNRNLTKYNGKQGHEELCSALSTTNNHITFNEILELYLHDKISLEEIIEDKNLNIKGDEYDQLGLIIARDAVQIKKKSDLIVKYIERLKWKHVLSNNFVLNLLEMVLDKLPNIWYHSNDIKQKIEWPFIVNAILENLDSFNESLDIERVLNEYFYDIDENLHWKSYKIDDPIVKEVPKSLVNNWKWDLVAKYFEKYKISKEYFADLMIKYAKGKTID